MEFKPQNAGSFFDRITEWAEWDERRPKRKAAKFYRRERKGDLREPREQGPGRRGDAAAGGNDDEGERFGGRLPKGGCPLTSFCCWIALNMPL